ncbi:MAG TPA: cytochrome P450 [Acidimicrobiia bacterium]|jgi:cytochrome P450
MAVAPPDVLDSELDVSLDDVDDLHEQLRDLAARKPAVWAKAFGEPAIVLLSHELVQAAFKDEETFPAAEFYGNVVTDVMGRNMQCMVGEEHRVNRALVSPAFRQRLMPGLVAPLLEPVAHELVDRFEPRGEAELVAEFTSRYPFTVICRLLGIPRHSEDEVKRWALGLLDIQGNYEHAVQCSREFIEFVTPILHRRRDDPGDDLISTLATTEVEGERLTDGEIFDFLRLLFPAGADTTYLGLGNTLFALLTHPDQLELVRSDLDTECRWAAEEGLRWSAPVAFIPRRSTAELVWHDLPVPGNTSIQLAIVAANRDPAVFDDPDRFDVRRRPASVLTFGFGAHFCLGAHLARAELETTLAVLLARLPRLRLADDDDARIVGQFNKILRGPDRLPVRFD